MASCNLRNFGPCLNQFREIQLFSWNLTDFVHYNKPFHMKTKTLADFQICINGPLNPFCNRGLDIKSTAHYLLHFPTYLTERRTLLSTIENIDNNLLDLSEPVLIKKLFFLAVIHLIQNGIQMFSMQLLNIFYPLKDLKNRFFNKVKKFSNKVMNQQILYL